jgi:hypothetical protein
MLQTPEHEDPLLLQNHSKKVIGKHERRESSARHVRGKVTPQLRDMTGHIVSLVKALCGLVADIVADLVVKLARGFGGESRSQSTEKNEHGEHEQTKDDDLARSGAVVAKLGPRQTALAQVLLDLIGTELVVDETTKSNAVAKSLEKSNWVAEEEHGGKDKEDIFEHTREREDERGGLADL